MRYALILAFLAGLCHMSVRAQTDTTQASVTAQNDTAQTGQKKITFTLGALYSNNASYYGQTATAAMPYVAASGVLQLPCGIYFSSTAYRLLNDTAHFVSATSAGAGISFSIGKKLTADLAYSHTFYPTNSSFLQAANPDNATASLKYKYWMTTGIQADYAFGKQQDIFVTLSTEKLIQLGSFSKTKDLVTITPSIDVVAGTQHFYETYIKERYLEFSKLGLPIPLLPGVPVNSQTVTKEATRFDLLSYNLHLPLAYNRAPYMLEVEYQLSLLSDKALTGAGDTHSFVNCSFYYQF